jgi:HSP20 family protein
MGLAHYIVKEVMKEIGNKSREFYEFVLPPIDIQLENDNLVVTVDLPGFDKKDIKLRIRGNILSINAKRETVHDGIAIWHQRPHTIDKKIRLPVDVSEGEDLEGSAKYHNGVLTLKIPVKHGKDIVIE